MLDQEELAESIRKEAALLLVQYELAERLSSLLAPFSGRAFNAHTCANIALALRPQLPGWEVNHDKPYLTFWSPTLLPYSERLVLEIKPNAVGMLDYMDILVGQLGPFLMGKRKAMELTGLITSVPGLVRGYNTAIEEVAKARSAFGPAAYLLPRISLT